jgi:DHA2 family multidrug resistance protein
MDPRKLLVVGVVLGGYTMFRLSHLNLNAGYWDIFWPQVLQGAAMAFLFIPLMTTSMSGIHREKMGNATSIYNLMRNIGGSFGIAIMTTFLARRNQVHQNHLIEKIQAGNPATRNMLRGLRGMFHMHGADNYMASRKALGALYGMVQRQAAMLSFVEAFWLMAILFGAMMPFLMLLKHARPEEPNAPPEETIETMPEAETEEAQQDELVFV